MFLQGDDEEWTNTIKGGHPANRRRRSRKLFKRHKYGWDLNTYSQLHCAALLTTTGLIVIINTLFILFVSLCLFCIQSSCWSNLIWLLRHFCVILCFYFVCVGVIVFFYYVSIVVLCFSLRVFCVFLVVLCFFVVTCNHLVPLQTLLDSSWFSVFLFTCFACFCCPLRLSVVIFLSFFNLFAWFLEVALCFFLTLTRGWPLAPAAARGTPRSWFKRIKVGIRVWLSVLT